jgi:hypothetical protein
LTIRDKISECLPHKDPLTPPDYTEAEVQSLRAVHGGTASSRQQRMSLDFLMRAFATYDTSFRPENAHLTSFCEGKRWCGTLIVHMLHQATTKTDPDKIAIRKLEVDPDARPDNR